MKIVWLVFYLKKENRMDLGFVKEDKWFRVRACAVIVQDDKILMCKNKYRWFLL